VRNATSFPTTLAHFDGRGGTKNLHPKLKKFATDPRQSPSFSKVAAMSLFRKIVAAALFATFGLAAIAVESSGGATAHATDACFGYDVCDH
jgi:hypothetical protein